MSESSVSYQRSRQRLRVIATIETMMLYHRKCEDEINGEQRDER